MAIKSYRPKLLKAANLFARLTGVTDNGRPGLMNGGYSKEEAREVVEAIQNSLDKDESAESQILLLRQAYEEYLDASTCSLAAIVEHLRTGDLIMQFSRHAILDRLITKGVLDRLYKRALRKERE